MNPFKRGKKKPDEDYYYGASKGKGPTKEAPPPRFAQNRNKETDNFPTKLTPAQLPYLEIPTKGAFSLENYVDDDVDEDYSEVEYSKPTKMKAKKKKGKERLSLRASFDDVEGLLRLKIEEALKAETLGPYKRSKLMVLGQGRVGKTSTIRSLMNQSFNPNQESTKGADVTRIDASNWAEDNRSYLAEHLEKLLSKDTDESAGKDKSKSKKNNSLKIPKEEMKRYGNDIVLGQTSDNLAFSIWDFGGQKVFYSLHHLFLTEFGCYLLIFDVTSMVDEKRRVESLEFIRFWLFSKKLHAPLAPILLVGTHADYISKKELMEVNELISTEVLGSNAFGEIHVNSMCFIDVENDSGRNIDLLRAKIEEVVRKQTYIEDMVPVSFLRVLELLLETNKQYISLYKAEDIMKSCGLNDDLAQAALLFLSQRGLITYFSEHETLRRYVILHPQWLISAVTEIIFDKDEHAAPEFDSQFGRDYRKFTHERVLSMELLTNIWDKKGHSADVQKFLRRVMLKSSLMCNYSFDTGENFLVPSLFTGGISPHEELKIEGDDYCGPFAVIDFSGNYDEEIEKDGGRIYVRYLPFGFFERFVCLCVDLSCLHAGSIKPKIGDQWARMSFGVDIDFELRVCNDDEGKPLWIKIKTDEDTTMEEVRDLVKMGYSMIEGLRDDFFEKEEGSSKLAISLLVPSSEETGNVLAEYNTLLKQYQDDQENLRSGKSKKSKRIRPCRVNRKKIALDSFAHWFETDSETAPISHILTDPDAGIQLQKQVSLSAVGNLKPMPNGLKYHCFLSYKQSSAIDMVGKQFYILTGKGYKCWYDQQFRGELNLSAMKEGVRDSMCYMLFLSKDIFPSPYVEEEVKMAVKLNKPIILVHHPDTGSVGYWQFGDYISKAPKVLQPLFAKVESIQLQRRHYLEEAVTHVIDERLTKICTNLIEN